MLAAAVESDTCLEVNTSGLIKELHQVHPAPTILSWAAEMGAKLTLGSDSHQATQVGQRFRDILPLLQRLGFNEIHGFRQRKRFSVAIDSQKISSPANSVKA